MSLGRKAQKGYLKNKKAVSGSLYPPSKSTPPLRIRPTLGYTAAL